jgi:hypothetical protein
MSLGTKFLLISNDPVFSFSLAFGHLGQFSVSSYFVSFAQLLCVGVDNTLIKGEIANTWSTCTHVVRFVMSDCQ